MIVVIIVLMSISINRQATHSSRARSIGTRRRTAISAKGSERERLLVEWIRKEGGTVDHIEVRQSERQGWYLEAREDVPSGASLIRLPGSCHVTYGDGDGKLVDVIEKVPVEFWSGRLSLKLLVERLMGEDSQFWPYLQTLPVGIPGIPLFYSKEAIEALQYPPLIAQIQKRCRWLMEFPSEDRAAIMNAARTDLIPDANLMGWALAAVSSRAFRVKGMHQPGSMLPLIDLCNHAFDPNCEVQPSNRLPGGVELITCKDIETGEALFINYGNLNNDDLLLDYGFLVKDNPYDNVQLAFDPELQLKDMARTDQDAMNDVMEWKRSMLEKLNFIGLDALRCVKIGNGDRTIDSRFHAASRILMSPIIPEGVSFEDLKNEKRCLDDEVELEALRMMAKMTVAALSRFPQDIDADHSLLQSKDMRDSDMALSIAFRVEKKQLLLNAVRYLAQCIRAIKD